MKPAVKTAGFLYIQRTIRSLLTVTFFANSQSLLLEEKVGAKRSDEVFFGRMDNGNR